MTIPQALRLPAHLLALVAAALPSLRGDIVINEVMSAGSERALQWSPTGVPQFGFGAPWHSLSFNDSTWQTANGPFLSLIHI